eukprot:TRINITY_DN4753_c0_g1_i1.p1 TRINITY_DN4753_c0_g1~~TRINITY_DN4753_c0_g1_i1.p1  ORF type:complete len:1003 (+),score=173.78 TRINITY_DN4753_c0_g1_i1:40-3048(+)
MQKILSILSQVGLVYLIAFIWFLDGVRGLWTDVLQKTSTGQLFLQIGAKEHVDTSNIINFAGSSAAVHTAIIFIGLGIGSKHKGDYLTMAKATTIMSIGSFFVLLFCFLNRHNWVYKYGSMFFHDEGCIPFAIVGAASMPIWFMFSLMFAQMDDRQKYLFPAIVAQYCERGVIVYLLTAVYFRFLCIPMWNYVLRFVRVVEQPYPLVTGEDTSTGTFGDFQSDLARVGSITHTIAFVLGTASCCVVNKFIKRPSMYAYDLHKSTNTDSWVLTSLVTGFMIIMSRYISFAFESDTRHIQQIATMFLGERRGLLEAFMCLSFYSIWFSAGIFFEQKWSGSASNNLKQPANELSIRANQETAEVDIVIGLVFMVIVWVLTLPLSWTIAAAIVYAVISGTGIAGVPESQSLKRRNTPPSHKSPEKQHQVIGSHRQGHSAIWGSLLSQTAEKMTKGQTILVLSLTPVSVRLVDSLIKRDPSVFVVVVPVSGDDASGRLRKQLSQHKKDNCSIHSDIQAMSALRSSFREEELPPVDVIFNLYGLHYGRCRMESGSTDVSTHHDEHVTGFLEISSFAKAVQSKSGSMPRVVSAFNAVAGGSKEWALRQANSIFTDPSNNLTTTCLRFGNIFGPDDDLLSRHVTSGYALISGIDGQANFISIFEVVATLLKADNSLARSDVLSKRIITINPHSDTTALDFFKSVTYYRPVAGSYQLPVAIPDTIASILFSSVSFFSLGCRLSPSKTLKSIGEFMKVRMPVLFTHQSNYYSDDLDTEPITEESMRATEELNLSHYSYEHAIQHCLDEYDYARAKANLAAAEERVQQTRELIKRFQGMENLEKEKPTINTNNTDSSNNNNNNNNNNSKKKKQPPEALLKKVLPSESTNDNVVKAPLPIVMCNPVTGTAVRTTPRCTAKAAFTSVINDLCTTLSSLSCGTPVIEEDEKGYDIVYPITGKLSSHLTDFLRKRVNPKLKEHVIFKGKCIRVNLLTMTDAVSLHHTVYGDVSSLGY